VTKHFMQCVLVCFVWSLLAACAHAQSFTVSPTSISFANQQIGSTSNPQAVTVTNSGTTSVTISAAAASPSEFVLVAGGAITLAPGAHTNYGVTFAPDEAQTFNGNLTLTISGSTPVLVPLTGSGVQNLSVTPISENFGAITVGQSSNGVLFQVTNIGTNAIRLASTAVAPSEFQLIEGTTAGGNLQPGATLKYMLDFVPDSAQMFTGTFTVNLSNNTLPIVIPLVGTGLSSEAAATVSPSSLSFPNVLLGTQSAQQIVTITNVGSVALKVAAPYATPPFIVGGFQTVTLNPTQQATMKVSMYGSFVGSYTGTLLISYSSISPSGVTLTGNTIFTSSLGITSFPTLPMGTQSSPYLATLQASGGNPPYTWSLSTGSTLPLGLSLASNGTISGTLDPSVAATTYKFNVQAVDSSVPPRRANKQLTFPVLALTGANCNDISFNVPGTSTPLVPLTDLGTGTYMGVQGGLYPGGSNVRPADHDAAGVTLANSIQPLDPSGNPNPNGIYALMSLGISDTQQEFIEFAKLANADPAKNPKLVLVNGAQFGARAMDWADPKSTFWTNLLTNTLPAAGVTAAQVTAAWVQDLDPSPTGVYPDDMMKTQADLEATAQNLHSKFPNLKLAYYTGRIYGGYGNGIQVYDPEPYAYDSNLAARGVILDQLSGLASLNWDPNVGAVMAPWLSWGPYYWANGLLARSDGLVWTCQDLKNDGLHPQDPLGRQKVSTYLMNFFKTDDTTNPWFMAH